jgi:hypothetical protein
MLFKEIIAVYSEKHAKTINMQIKIASWGISILLGFNSLT